jgi:glutaredoxin
MKEILILPVKSCKRSKRILQFLTEQGIPFQSIDPHSSTGQEMIAKYNFQASPGIVVNGKKINPFDLLIQPDCRINEEGVCPNFVGVKLGVGG